MSSRDRAVLVESPGRAGLLAVAPGSVATHRREVPVPLVPGARAEPARQIGSVR